MEIELFGDGCPICRRQTKTSPHCVLDGKQYVSCHECGLIYQVGRTDLDAVLACYTGGFLKRSRRRLLNRLRKIENQRDFDLRMKRARQIFDFAAAKAKVAKGNYLDIGCNKGFNLYAAYERGWEPYGNELIEEITLPIRNSLKKLRDRISIGGFSDISHHFPNNFFDLITGIDIIEHLPDPLGALQEMRRTLKPGAPLVLQTPDATPENIALKERWGGLKANEHLLLFNKENLGALCRQAGFTSLELAPEPFEVCDGNFVAILT